MKIGYPCKNWSIDCTGDKTFRLKSYSEKRMKETIKNNLNCLKKMLSFNVQHNLLFFRITSDLIPFASHPICAFDWQSYFSDLFNEIGTHIQKNDIRISMHPDQFIVLNSPKKEVVERSIAELQYHANVLDVMNLSDSAKIQLHVGGIYNDKQSSVKRFISNFKKLNNSIKNRLVLENDDARYSINDCINISSEIHIPILLDVFHHSILHNNESIDFILNQTSNTWSDKDGILMLDYSQQEPNQRKGKHAETITMEPFSQFIDITKPYDFDIMLEIKDKEKSALKAMEVIKNDERFKYI